MEQPYQGNRLDFSRGTGCEGGWQLLVQQNNNRGATRRGIFHTCQAAMLKLNKAEQGVCLYVYLCVCVFFFNVAV